MRTAMWALPSGLGAIQLLAMAIAVPSGASATETDNVPVCLTGRILGGSATGSGFTIIAPRPDVQALAGRGFAQRGCGNLLKELPAIRSQLCNYASQAPGDLLERFRKAHGITVGELCSLATRAGGAA